MPVPLPLSVVIIALNEEQRIGDCLASVRGLTDDVLVVDAHSSDHTAEIAVAHGARVLTRAWTSYSDQKNFGNEAARHDWILSLDADERVTPDLAASIRAEFAQGPGCDGYRLHFQNYFGASLVRFGAWNPESHLRLFDRRKFQWSCDAVHEGLRRVEPGRMGKLAGCIRHFSVDSPTQLAAKTQRYSVLFADQLRRQHRHPSWWKIWLNPGFRFARDYFIRGGMLDGHAGLIIAWESARYTHLKYWLARSTPDRRALSPWLSWRTATTTGMMLALVAVLFLGAKQELNESRNRADSVWPARRAAAEYNDGFDNNPIGPLNRAPDDEEVLI